MKGVIEMTGIIERIDIEYEKVRNLFSECDEKILLLNDGVIREFARIKVELDDIHEIVKQTGLIKTHPDNPFLQKELVATKTLTRCRANYLNYAAKLSSILGKELIAEEDFDLDEFE